MFIFCSDIISYHVIISWHNILQWHNIYSLHHILHCMHLKYMHSMHRKCIKLNASVKALIVLIYKVWRWLYFYLPNNGDIKSSHEAQLIQSCMHKEKYFRNVVKSTRNQIVFTIFRLTWIQTDIHLDPSHSKNSNYNLISGWFNKISNRFLRV